MVQDADARLAQFSAKADELKAHFQERLRKAVKVPSISAYAKHREDVFEMARMLKAEMESLGIEVKLKELGREPGTDIALPPIVMGRYGRDKNKPTILVYSHYDVQPASIEDGWDFDPWDMEVQDDGRMWGRGTSDDKGPLLCWLNMIEAFQQANVDVPANLTFWFEGMEENGSIGLRGALEEASTQALVDVDAVCVTDTIWAGASRPSITQGLRGVLFYIMEISGAKQDAHSGMFGGHISEPMTDMVHILSSLVDSTGKIQVPGIYEHVRKVTPDEYRAYQSFHLTTTDLDGGIEARSLHDTDADILISRWRMPSLSLHRIENAKPGAGATTAIPAKLLGKFSIRTVPDMDSAKVDQLVREHIERKFAGLQSKNDLSLSCVHQSDWFFEDANHWNYKAAASATKAVWNVDPDIACEGGSIPVALDFKQVLNKNVLLLPVGRPTDGAHSVNEKLDEVN